MSVVGTSVVAGVLGCGATDDLKAIAVGLYVGVAGGGSVLKGTCCRPMSDDVALRVVDDRNRSRNWSRAPSSLGVRLQLFETRARGFGARAFKPLMRILTKLDVLEVHERVLVCLQYLVFPMLQSTGSASSAFESALDGSEPSASLVKYRWYVVLAVSLVSAGAAKLLRESEESDAGVVSVMDFGNRKGRVGR